MKRTALSIAAACIAATQAYASGPSDPVVMPAPLPPVSDWTGTYLGLNIAAGNYTGPAVPGGSLSYSAFGGHIGYLHDTGDWVLGVELNAERQRISAPPGPAAPPNTLTRVGLDALLGYDRGNLLPFLGLGVARLSQAGISVNGVALSLGLTAKVSDNFLVTGKLRFSRYPNTPGGVLNDAALVLQGSYQF